MSIHNTPATLSKALGGASKKITAVSYEYPGFWLIETKSDTYSLGDVNGFISWHTQDGTEADHLPNSSEYTKPETIALAFAKWVEQVEVN